MLVRPKLTHVALVIVLSYFATAKADVRFLDAAPTAPITVTEATKGMAENKPQYKCERVRTGPSGNPVKVPGTTATWHASVAQGLDNPFAALAENKPTWRCTLMEANTANGRVRRAQQ